MSPHLANLSLSLGDVAPAVVTERELLCDQWKGSETSGPAGFECQPRGLAVASGEALPLPEPQLLHAQNGDETLPQLPRAVVTKRREWGGLKQRRVISRFWRPEVQSQGASRAGLPLKARGREPFRPPPWLPAPASVVR